MSDIDWNLARAFLATADCGSLSAAARQLGLTQPTLSRQVAALEADLGVTLFERLGKRLVLTDTGASLLGHVRAMGDAAGAMRLAASGRAADIAGRVSISATDAYAAYILPEILARIRRAAPQITVSVISTDSISDLRRREADIALRHVRPTDEGLIGQLMGESHAGFYAAPEWLARHADLRQIADLAPQDLIGFDEPQRFTETMRGMGMQVTDEGLRLISNSSLMIWEMVRRGLGTAAMLREIAERTDGVLRILPEVQLPRFPLWLVTHRELRTSRRIRLVYDILAEELPQIIDGRATARRDGLIT